MLTRDIVGGGAALAIGAGYLAMAMDLRTSALDDAVGPAGVPTVLGGLMVVLGLCLLLQGIVTRRGARATGPAIEEDADEGDSERVARSGLVRAGGLLAIAVGYLLIVRLVGYVPAIAALIIAAALHGGASPGWRVVAIGVAGALFYYVLFVLVLGIPLPAGPLFSLS